MLAAKYEFIQLQEIRDYFSDAKLSINHTIRGGIIE
jgi:hypothetical protein